MPRVTGTALVTTLLAGALLALAAAWLARPSQRGQVVEPGLAERIDEPGSLDLIAGPAVATATTRRGTNQDSDVAPTPPPATIDELLEAIEAILARHDVPGVGLSLVQHDGTMWAGGAGKASRETGADVGPDTVFRVASISKSVIALAVLALCERGLLRLDMPVAELAPEIALDNRWAKDSPVTLAELLEHTAGFDDMRFNETYSGSDDDLSLAEVLALNPRSRASRWRPGSRHAYANPGYTVTAYLIEKATGERFEDHVEEAILRPMGMATASFRAGPELRERLAQGYAGWRNRPVAYRRIHHRPAGELLASPRELARLVKLLIDRGVIRGAVAGRRGAAAGRPLVGPASIARMERSETTSLPALDVSYGLGNHGDTSLPVVMHGHNGGLPGFASEYRYSADLGVGYVLLFNSTSDTVIGAYLEIRQLVMRYLLRDREIPPPPPAIELPASELARHAGFYELAGPRHALTAFLDRVDLAARVQVSGGHLHIALGNGWKSELVATGPGRFRLPGHSGTAIAFTARPDGTAILLLGNQYYERDERSLGPTRQFVVRTSMWLMDVLIFGLIVWLPGWLWVSYRKREHRFPLPPGSLASLASLCFFSMLRVFHFGWTTGQLGEPGLVAISVFIASVLFPLLAILAVVQTARWLLPSSDVRSQFFDAMVDEAGFLTSIYQQGWTSSFYSIAGSIACLIMAGFFALHGFIALRTWAW